LYVKVQHRNAEEDEHWEQEEEEGQQERQKEQRESVEGGQNSAFFLIVKTIEGVQKLLVNKTFL